MNTRITKQMASDAAYAISELRTIKAVQRSMPEALKYLDVPAEINPPARVYDDLRQILQTLNTKDNEKDTSSDSQV